LEFIYNDGGRKEAGFKGETNDCVTRAIAIATQLPYRVVYDGLNLVSKSERLSKRKRKKSSSRTGIFKATYRKYLKSIGWEWVPIMSIGKGCTIHLKTNELPTGKLVVRLSKHLTCVADGVIHDTFDPSRNETRCVYGYFKKETIC
jgi:hypothetical protein